MTTTHDVTLEAHRAHCADCRALWAELEAISAEAARLPTLTPSRDLWQGIEARLGAAPAASGSADAVAAASGGSATRQLPWHMRPGLRLALAASMLIAVTAGVTWQLASNGTERGVASLPAVADESSGIHLAAFNESVTQMDREIAELRRIVEERGNALDPQTLQVLETNLALIDAAIGESRAALAADPASQFLAAQFARAYTAKLTLLRDAATLPTGI